MKKISVIIPVWNTEKYVGECIDSILAQSIIKDLEIICVNDGSTDSSLEILRGYEKQYEQIKVIDQVNGGLSFARNAALEQACGKYVYFMDSDDLLTSFALEELWKVCEDKKLDVLYFSGTSFYENQELTEAHSAFSNAYYRKGNYKEVLTGEKMLVELRQNKDYMSSACLQIIRRDFLNEKNIRFYNGILHEDNCFTFKTLLQAERTFCVNDIYFYRRVREQSIMTRQENWKNLKGYFCCLMDQMQLVGELNIQDIEVNKEIYNILWMLARHVQRIYMQIPQSEREIFNNSCTAYERCFMNAILIKAENEKKKETNKLKRQLKKIKRSNSYRIGRKVTLPVRLVKGGVKCWKQHGFIYTCKLTVKKIKSKMKREEA